MLRFSEGKVEAAVASIRHHRETEANWMIVRVAGLSKAFNIDFEEVLVKAEVMYHVMHSA
jgi:hypothetical protein